MRARALIFSMYQHFFSLWPWTRGLAFFFSKTLSLLINFEKWVLELWYFTFLVTRPFCGYPETLTWEFGPLFENFNHVHNSSKVSVRSLIYYITFSCDKPIPWIPTLWSLWPWSLEFGLLFENFTFVYNFSTLSAWALMFHMSIPCD